VFKVVVSAELEAPGAIGVATVPKVTTLEDFGKAQPADSDSP
jgi:hypothetical protein